MAQILIPYLEAADTLVNEFSTLCLFRPSGTVNTGWQNFLERIVQFGDLFKPDHFDIIFMYLY